MTRQPLLVVLLVVLVAIPAAAGLSGGAPASQQAPNATGDYSRQYLTQGGTHAGGAPSTRLLDGHQTWVQIHYKPAKPLGGDKVYLEPGAKLRTNDITVVSGAIGDVEPMTLEVVSWQKRTRQVETENGITSKQVAANVSSQSYRIEHGFYQQTNITLPAHFDQQWQITMLLRDQSGDVVGRWRFKHKSNPLMKAAPGVDSKGDLHTFGMLYYLLPSLGAVLFSRWHAPRVLEQIKVGPLRSMVGWGFITFVGLFVGSTLLFYQVAVLFTYIPLLAGLTVGVVAYLTMLTIHDQQTEQAAFYEPVLETRTTPDGDETPGSVGFVMILRRIYRQNNTVYLPSSGFLPMLARYWADPASMDETEYTSLNEASDPGESDVSVKYDADPEADPTAIDVTPAHLDFAPELVTGHSDEDREDYRMQLAEYSDQGLAGAAASLPTTLRFQLGALNWPLIYKATLGFGAIYLAFATLGLTTLGMVLGLLPGIAAGTHARDGSVEFVPAPHHFGDARWRNAEDIGSYEKADTFEQVIEQTERSGSELREWLLELSDKQQYEADKELGELLGMDGVDGNGHQPTPDPDTREVEQND